MEVPLGIVRVHLSSLDFPRGREVDEKIVSKIIEVFRSSPHGCDPNHDLNIIPAQLDQSDLQQLLQSSNLTLVELKESLVDSTFRPVVTAPSLQLRCQHGRHRVEAAKQFLPIDTYWWIVKLFLCDDYNKDGQRSSHESKFSDGEIYHRVRQFQRSGQDDFAEEWKLLLSHSKRRDLSWLLKRSVFTDQLDTVSEFSGLRDGLELGNVRRHLALHCDREIRHYLHHVFSNWDDILLHNNELRASTDIETVRLLQGRCPWTSETDRQYIVHEMGSHRLFPRILNFQHRQQITHRLLHLRVIIPTIKTLHENCKLLEIAVKVIREILQPKRVGLLIDALREIWRKPADCLIEVQEGIFRAAMTQRDEDHFNLAYLQLILAAIRKFGSLSETPPRRDIKRLKLTASVDTKYRELFIARAILLGFGKDTGLMTSHSGPIDLPPTKRRIYSKPIKSTDIASRCGRPFDSAYQELQDQLFLPQVTDLPRASQQPSPLFIVQDFLKAFFEISYIQLDRETQPTSLILLPIQLHSEESSSRLHATASGYGIRPLSQFTMAGISERNHIWGVGEGESREISNGPLSMDVEERIETDVEYISDQRATNSEAGGEQIRNQRSRSVSSSMSDGLVPDDSSISSSQISPDLIISPEIRDHELPSLETSANTNFGALFVPTTSPVSQWDSPAMEEEAWRSNSPTTIQSTTGSYHEAVALPSQGDEGISLQGRRTYANGLIWKATEHNHQGEATDKEGELSNEGMQVALWTARLNSRNHRSYAAAAVSSIPTGQPLHGWQEPDRRESARVDEVNSSLAHETILANRALEGLQSSQGTRSYASPSKMISFTEFNGMKSSEKITNDLKSYLDKRKRWVGMVSENGVLRTIRLDQIISYVERIGLLEGRSLVLVKQEHAERFRRSHELKRKVQGNTAAQGSIKRTRL